MYREREREGREKEGKMERRRAGESTTLLHKKLLALTNTEDQLEIILAQQGYF